MYLRTHIVAVVACIAAFATAAFAQAQTPSTRPARIAVVLPFKAKQSEGRRSLEFYRGVLLAADAMRGAGYNIQIEAYDEGTPDDSINATIEKAASSADMLLGFYYRNHMMAAANYCDQQNVNVAFPLASYIPQALRTSKSSVFPQADTGRFVDSYCNLISKCFGKSNVIVLHAANAQSAAEIIDIANNLRRQGTKFKSIEAKEVNGKSFTDLLSTKKCNLLFVDTNDTTELARIFSQINEVASTTRLKFAVMGTSQWTALPTEIFAGLAVDLFYPTLQYVNPAAASISGIVSNYEEWFHCQPSDKQPSALLEGYDWGTFVIGGLATHGRSFIGSPTVAPLASNRFEFERIAENGCWANAGLRLVHRHPNGSIDLIELNK